MAGRERNVNHIINRASPAGDFERGVGDRKNSHHPSPPFGANLQILLYARPGDSYADTIQIGDDRKRKQKAKDAMAIFHQRVLARNAEAPAERRDIGCVELLLAKYQHRMLGKGALYPAVMDKQVREQVIPLPPLSEQKRIAGILKEQMAAVERARHSAEAQLQAAESLPAAYLRAVFNSRESQRWEKKVLGEICIDIYRYPSFYGMEHRSTGVPVIRGEHVRTAGEISCAIYQYQSASLIFPSPAFAIAL